MTKIKRLREEKGMTLAEFFRAADVHPPTGYKLEKGNHKAGPVLRQRVAKALGVPEGDLFDWKGWPVVATEEAPQ